MSWLDDLYNRDDPSIAREVYNPSTRTYSDRIELRGFKPTAKELADMEEKAREFCEKERNRKTRDFFDFELEGDYNHGIRRDKDMIPEASSLLLEKRNFDEALRGQREEIERTGKRLLDMENLMGRKDIADKVFNSENFRHTEKTGKTSFTTYGFDNDEVFDAMCKKARGYKDVEIPQPKLKELSLADKIKKKLTGTCKTEQFNEKIAKGYDAFVNNTKDLFQGINIEDIPGCESFFRVEDFKEAYKTLGETRKAVAGSYKHQVQDYFLLRHEERIYNEAIDEANAEIKQDMPKLQANRDKKVEEERDNILKNAQKQFDPQFRDTDVPRTDAEKKEVAIKRYDARKLLAMRGLLPQARQKEVKPTSLPNNMNLQKGNTR